MKALSSARSNLAEELGSGSDKAEIVFRGD